VNRNDLQLATLYHINYYQASVSHSFYLAIKSYVHLMDLITAGSGVNALSSGEGECSENVRI
jgi:hypothetical protein